MSVREGWNSITDPRATTAQRVVYILLLGFFGYLALLYAVTPDVIPDSFVDGTRIGAGVLSLFCGIVMMSLVLVVYRDWRKNHGQ